MKASIYLLARRMKRICGSNGAKVLHLQIVVIWNVERIEYHGNAEVWLYAKPFLLIATFLHKSNRISHSNP